ncbi:MULTISPECIES: hypothetical protein [unclassified Nocardiopsis]|uniref:hypothetical protein n=1 Tax=Nocardiopsis TaxID=2013 RepID=UPI00387B04D9
MPSIRATSTAGTWQDATSVSVPFGTQDGDLMLTWLSANFQHALTPPAGWALVTSVVEGDLGTGTAVYLYSRVADSESSPYTWTWSGEHWHFALCVSVQDTAGIRDAASVGSEGESSDIDEILLPSVDAVAGDLLLAFGYHWGTDPGSEPTFDDLEEVVTSGSLLVAALEDITSTGPTEQFPLTSAALGRMAAAAVALAPVSSGEEADADPFVVGASFGIPVDALAAVAGAGAFPAAARFGAPAVAMALGATAAPFRVGATFGVPVVGVPTPPGEWQPIPERQPLPPASEWRYRAFNVLTGASVDPDLPLEDVKITLALSGPCGITATIDPEHPELYDDSGALVFVEWQTLLVAEAAGQIRGAGLVTNVDDAGQKLSITATGVSGYPEGQPIRTTLTWGGKTDGLTGAGVDPLDVVRSIWTQLQDQPDGDLGVVVDEIGTPYRLGEWRGGIRKRNEDGSLGPAKEVDGQPVPIDKIWDPKTDRKPVAATGKSVYWQYQIPWWDDVDAGQKITQLGTQAQFEYAEEYRWSNADRTALTKRIRLGYPRLGKRSDRAFVEDENIVDLVVVRRDGDDYANSVTVNGAGEGSKKVRGSASTRDGRARRSKTLDRPDLTTAAACKAAAEEELRKWSRLVDITSFVVIDHPNAPLGSFAPGDDVLVETTGRRWLPTRLWVRITDMTITPGSDEIAVTCRRSDRFSYPGGV